MELNEKLKLVVNALSEKLANDIRVIEIGKISTIADYFVIADGKNKNQLDAMCDGVEEQMAKAKLSMKNREGNSNTGWILLDYYDIIIHIFSEEARSFYDLEHIWRDGNLIDMGELLS